MAKANEKAAESKPRSPQKSLALDELIPVDFVPEKKSGTRNSALSKIADTLRDTPLQWYKIGNGRTQSAYQKRKRLADMSNGDGKFQAEVRSTDEPGVSDIFARYVPADAKDGS